MRLFYASHSDRLNADRYIYRPYKPDIVQAQYKGGDLLESKPPLLIATLDLLVSVVSKAVVVDCTYLVILHLCNLCIRRVDQLHPSTSTRPYRRQGIIPKRKYDLRPERYTRRGGDRLRGKAWPILTAHPPSTYPTL
jgi:hypothetical protein